MEKMISVIQIVLPIFCCVCLGILARRRKIFTSGEIQGFQRFIMKFCLPCLLFQSCLTAKLGPEALSGAVLPVLLVVAAIWGFRVGRKKFPYHNAPFLFCCKETGMLGIPLFIILFGADQAYRLGILDVMQAFAVYPVIGILSAAPGKTASAKDVVREMCKSPLMIMSFIGLVLNLSGAWDWIQGVGVGGIVLDTVSYLAQPVSSVMLFCVGYNFSLEGENRREVFRIIAVHMGIFVILGTVFQGILFLFPGVDPMTRWAVLLYTFLPTSYMSPGFGRKEEDYTIASGVCSMLTVLSLAVFCIIAVIVS